MKPTFIKNGPLVPVLAAMILTAGLLSWNTQQQPGKYQQVLNDTVPKKKIDDQDKNIRDLDQALEELEKAERTMGREKIRQQLDEAIKEIDFGKIKAEIDQAMKSVDMEKMKKEIESSLAQVDFEKVRTQMAEVMKNMDIAKVKMELEQSMAKLDWDKLKIEMEKAKDIDMKDLEKELLKVKEEMKDLGPRLEKEMSKAREEIGKSKEELSELKGFLDGLESDGLINKTAGYTLTHKNGELLVNGKKVSKGVYNKYRPFLEKHPKFEIKKNDDGLKMD